MATAALNPPRGGSDWTTRARAPLAALAALLVAIDFIGLGVHWADANNSAVATPAQVKAQLHVTVPQAVVSSGDVAAANASSPSSSSSGLSALYGGTTPSGAAIGPVAPPVVSPTPTSPSTGGTTPTPVKPAVPLAQVDVAVPALGAQLSVGLGNGACTTVDLTLLALGGCPMPTGDGPIVLHLGGSLLGQKSTAAKSLKKK